MFNFDKKDQIQAIMDRLDAMESGLKKELGTLTSDFRVVLDEVESLKDAIRMMQIRERGATINQAFGGSIHSPSLEFGVKSSWSPRKSARFRGIF